MSVPPKPQPYTDYLGSLEDQLAQLNLQMPQPYQSEFEMRVKKRTIDDLLRQMRLTPRSGTTGFVGIGDLGF